MNLFGRKYLALLCALICIVLTVTAFTVGGEVAELANTEAAAQLGYAKNHVPNPASDFTYSKMGTRISITGYTGTATEVVIPSTIEALPVEIITASAFCDSSSITSVYIPSSVLRIAAGAFSKCDALISIEVSEESTAFSSVDGVLYNKELTELIVCPGGKTGKFFVPEGCTTIKSKAFYYCYSLTEIDMANTVTTIGSNAFSFCWRLTHVRLSDALISLGNEAFLSCESLTTIYLPSVLTAIGTDALLGFRNSDSDYCYNFIDGVFCVKDSFAESYVRSIGLTPVITTDTRTNPLDGISASADFAESTLFDAHALTSGEVYNKVAALGAELGFEEFRVIDAGCTVNGETAALPDGTRITVDIRSNAARSAVGAYIFDGDTLAPIDCTTHSDADRVYAGFSVPTSGIFVVAERYVFTKTGDADGDGVLTTDDARLVLRAAVGLENLLDSQMEAIDFDKDGIPDTDEARKILRVVVRLDSFDD